MGYIYSKIDNFLDKTEFSKSRRIDFIDFIVSPKKENSHIKNSIKIFDEIEKMINENPQELVGLSKNVIYHNQNLTKLFSFLFSQKGNKESLNQELGYSNKIESISVFWEVSRLLKFPAYLLSGRRVRIENIKEREKIFSHFKFLGIDKKDIDLIRRIRNAHYHPFTFRNGFLINDKGEEVCTFQTIDNILKKISVVLEWWLFTFASTIYYNPSFAIYGYYALRNELGQNEDLYFQYLETFQEYLPIFQTDKSEKKLNKDELPLLAVWISKSWKFIKNPISYIKGYFATKVLEGVLEKAFRSDVSKEDMCFLINKLRGKILEFGLQMTKLSPQLKNENDRVAMKRIGQRIEENATIPINIEDDLNKKLFNLIKIRLEDNEKESDSSLSNKI